MTTPTFHLHTFTVADLLACAEYLKAATQGATSMEEVAATTVTALYHTLVTPDHQRACVLVRFFTTLRYADLDIVLRAYARARLDGTPPDPDMKCLTLLGTVGDKSAWNARKMSVGHQVIPLPGPDIVAQSPMIAQLIHQFGLDIGTFLTPDPGLLLTPKRTYNVFYVPDAVGNPTIPAQYTFVIPMGIRSVVGFGGIFPSGNLFAVILFSKISIPREVAERFKSLALTLRGVTLPHDTRTIFARG